MVGGMDAPGPTGCEIAALKAFFSGTQPARLAPISACPECKQRAFLVVWLTSAPFL
jgi:hypothetical protein